MMRYITILINQRNIYKFNANCYLPPPLFGDAISKQSEIYMEDYILQLDSTLKSICKFKSTDYSFLCFTNSILGKQKRIQCKNITKVATIILYQIFLKARDTTIWAPYLLCGYTSFLLYRKIPWGWNNEDNLYFISESIQHHFYRSISHPI